jgi:mannose-P-dolichol utilization defect protein 1
MSAFPCAKLTLSTPLEILDPPCLKFCVSKTLGYGIVAGSAGVKLPQLVAIYRAGGVSGLSGTSIVVEMASLVCSFAYYLALGYPFSTWGENIFLFFGQIVMTAFYFHFTSGVLSAKAVATALPLIALGSALYTRSVPPIQLPPALCEKLPLPNCVLTCEQLAGGLPMVLMLFGRLPQIVQNLKQGHTGQLSLITYLLNTAGGAARVFTVMQRVRGSDPRLAAAAPAAAAAAAAAAAVS